MIPAVGALLLRLHVPWRCICSGLARAGMESGEVMLIEGIDIREDPEQDGPFFVSSPQCRTRITKSARQKGHAETTSLFTTPSAAGMSSTQPKKTVRR